MRHPKIIIAGLGIAAVAAAGSITAASTGSSSASSKPQAGHSATAATVHIVPATVAGKTETVLVNSRGLPLYYYRPDTAAKSAVSGALAALWPPVTSASAVPAAGVSGKLTLVSDAHGNQVAYNGHLLYTFADDHAGQVTGQGVQNFFVATPGLAQIGSSTAPSGGAPAAPSSPGFGY
jgi:predicted lipoprotein with Yx(FWY)xxD motif